jgi:outer membrane protein TolC
MRTATTRQRFEVLLVAAAVSFVAACSADQYRRDADKEVGEIIDQKEERLFGKASGFTVETARDMLRMEIVTELEKLREQRQEQVLKEVLPPPEDVPIGPAKKTASELAQLSPETSAEQQEKLEQRLTDVAQRHAAELAEFSATAPPLLPLKILALPDALEIAANNSRDYQSQKEQVYLVALELTFQRYLFSARFGVTTSYDWSSTDVGSGPRQRDGTLTTQFSLTQQLASGGVVVFDFVNSILKRFTGIEFGNGTNHTTTSLIDLSFSQPILQGFGKEIAQEPLVQSERETVYQLRSFERFRQDFAVQVASEYYNLLQQLDSIENARRSYIQFIDAREQSEALAEKGRRSQIELDQATSSELSARNSWILAQRNYEDQLDRFKITLGLPMESNLALDPGELTKLREIGVPRVDLDEPHAIAVALQLRLDHMNSIEQLEDSDRRIRVAADDLRAALNLDGSVTIPTKADEAFAFRGDQATWRVGATLDLPVDKLSERNSYRRALIAREQQARAVSLSEDSVKQEVRDALRRLAQLRETWRIAVDAVEVAERRVQSTALTLRMGRIQIRDALDATDSLNRSLNSLTSALVDYQIARLELSRDMGLLHLGEHGVELLPPPPPPPPSENRS